jgi:hypothetical protein
LYWWHALRELVATPSTRHAADDCRASGHAA